MGKLGLKEVIAMGVGGMVSGGIFAVLGVAMQRAGNAVAFSFLIAGILTLLTAYSYVKLTLHFKEEGGTFSFIAHAVDNMHIAGVIGWLLIIGYVGVMALYAFAFGSYLVSMLGYPVNSLIRQLISASIIFIFVGLNLSGVKETAIYQDIAVYLKIALLISLAFLGIYFSDNTTEVIDAFFNEGILPSITAFAIIFVAYEGFQLLTYGYKEIENVDENLPRGMYIAIIIAMLIYISVSFMATLHITPEEVITNKEFALGAAVRSFLGTAGFIIVIISALQSTSSGINATLFGTARLTRKISIENELPEVFSYQNQKKIPVYSLIIIGILSASFAFMGTLEEITTFGSIVFLIADAAANYANLKLYKKTNSIFWIPLAALTGCIIAIPIVFYHLYMNQFHVLISIISIFVIMLLLNGFYIMNKKRTKNNA
ncbi:L-asparagine transporter [Methanolobus vulcani]|jgi:amino acid transporter|uniref:L-asparagine transporter n=1 Tax=Methanolobus vulcani TaxID=38026 RepID=A0A7Z7FF37_9EURY|nr:APC family permease [Methanolobus vulcani]MDK2826261.1 hypothetical protein [Methanolobus sp.]MDK2948016.1 hypothetical protein [Methanolobus sp.]SDG20010.1 L-asparagine transporter [Methanolobus vulcani]